MQRPGRKGQKPWNGRPSSTRGWACCASRDRCFTLRLTSSRHPRPGHVARHELDDVSAEQARAASEEAESRSVTLNAYVLDCRLPGDEPPEVRPTSGRSPRQRKGPSAADG